MKRVMNLRPDITFSHDWTMLVCRQNWYDFTFIYLMVENDVSLGQIEVCAALVGFHIRLTWDTGETALGREIAAEHDRILRAINTDTQEPKG